MTNYISRTFPPEDRPYLYWLCSHPHLNERYLSPLFDTFQSAGDIWKASPEQIKSLLLPSMADQLIRSRSEWAIEKEYEKLLKSDVHFLLSQDPEYPEKLRSIADPPLGLFYRGSLPNPNLPSVAVIGARDCSPYGSAVASELGGYLGANGIQVISGMAIGIDGISQSAALSKGGRSFAVLGSGPDICYPMKNKGLYQELLLSGGLISTYTPGTPAKSSHFPPRNRIVSGLSDLVVVVEARQRSGTLITVDMALEQGREVYAVPGKLTDRLSDGCNSLLWQGAQIYISPESLVKDLMTILRCSDPGSPGNSVRKLSPNDSSASSLAKLHKEAESPAYPKPQSEPKLSPELKKVFHVLDYTPKSPETILKELGSAFSISQVNLLLMELAMKGHAVQLSQGYFCLLH